MVVVLSWEQKEELRAPTLPKKGKDWSKKQGNKMTEEDGQEASVTDEPIPWKWLLGM